MKTVLVLAYSVIVHTRADSKDCANDDSSNEINENGCDPPHKDIIGFPIKLIAS